MTGFRLAAGVIAASIATSFATEATPARAEAERLAVVATFSIIGDFAAVVGGDRIALRTLVGPDSDAHVYHPKPADAIAVARADIVLENGLAFEGFMGRLVAASESSATIVTLTNGADILHDPAGGHYHYTGGEAVFHAAPNDPHAWQSVANARVYVENIREAFCAADAEGCPAYEANAAAYLEELAALDDETRRAIAAIPEEKRVAVVAHNAFRYFERDYGVTFLAPQGVSTESEASAADVASLIREIRAQRAAAVFAENISDRRLVTQIAEEAGLPLGGTLHSDALSPPGGPAASYLDMMRHNLRLLVTAIDGR